MNQYNKQVTDQLHEEYMKRQEDIIDESIKAVQKIQSEMLLANSKINNNMYGNNGTSQDLIYQNEQFADTASNVVIEETDHRIDDLQQTYMNQYFDIGAQNQNTWHMLNAVRSLTKLFTMV